MPELKSDQTGQGFVPYPVFFLGLTSVVLIWNSQRNRKGSVGGADAGGGIGCLVVSDAKSVLRDDPCGA
jgi:hypothetical protein